MVAPLEIVGGAVGTIVGGLIVREAWYRRKQNLESQSEHEDWYADAVSHCEQGLQALRNFENTSHPNYDETRMEMRATSSQISRHVGNAAGMDIDEDVVEALREAGQACQAVNNSRTSIGDTSEWDDALEWAQDSLSEAKENAERYL
jgi:uncharacterized protein (DUF4415 family)